MTDQYVDGLADEIAEKVASRLGADRALLTIADLAERLALSDRAARVLVYGNRSRGVAPAIPSIIVGEGSRRIAASAVDEYVRSRQADE